MAIAIIEFIKKKWDDNDEADEVFAEAIFDKIYLRDLKYINENSGNADFEQYLRSGSFIKDFRKGMESLDYPSKSDRDVYYLEPHEIVAPERLLNEVKTALKDAVNYEHTDSSTAKVLQAARDLIRKSGI